jgi:hypothetical protein
LNMKKKYVIMLLLLISSNLLLFVEGKVNIYTSKCYIMFAFIHHLFM